MRLLPTPTIYAGPGSLAQISTILDDMNADKVMIVTDKGIVAAGIYAKLEKLVKDAGKSILLFDNVQPDPEIGLVAEASQIARDNEIDAIIGLGGGSSLDTAKVVAALTHNAGEIDQYLGIDMLKKDSLPVIAIPTTAGTGSEVTHIAILSDTEAQLKKGIVSPRLVPKVAILDAELTIGLPPHITAFTGMDALTHAMEAYTSVNANDHTDMLAIKAITMIAANMRRVYQEGGNLEARNAMLMGSMYAGVAFSIAGCAAVHAFAYPLGGMFHVPHGLANSAMLATILEYNMPGNEAKYIEMGKCFTDGDVTPTTVIDQVNTLCNDLSIPALKDIEIQGHTIPRDAIPEMAKRAMLVTRLLANNPREVTEEAAVEIYTQAYDG